MAIKFGAKQLKNPTPPFLKVIFKSYAFLAGLWALFAPGLTHLPVETLALINQILLMSTPVMGYIITFFGLDYDMNGGGQTSQMQFQPNTAFQVRSYLDIDQASGKNCYELADLYPEVYALINDDNGNPNLCVYSTAPVQKTFIDHITNTPYVLTTVDFVGGRPVGR